MRWCHFAVAVGAAALLVVVPSHVAPSAFAETILPPSSPPPLNGLPSTVIGSTSVTGASRLEYQMSLLYRWSKKPAFWQAVNDVQTGIATSSQSSLVAAEAAAYKVPATRLATPLKVIGGAATAVTGFQFGTAIGNGVMTLVGIDVDGLVCAQGDAAGFLGLLTGADCSGLEFDPGYPINSDSVVKPDGWTVPVLHRGTAIDGAYAFQCVVQPVSVASNSITYSCLEGGSYSTTSQGGLMGSGRVWCKNDTTGAFTAQNRLALTWPGPTTTWNGSNPLHQDAMGSSTLTCPVGTSPYSLVVSSSEITGAQDGGSSSDPQWFSAASPNYTPETVGDPSRSLRCVVVGSDGLVYSASTDGYFESSGALPAPVCPDLPPGVIADTVTIFEDSPLGSTELWSESTTPEFDAASQLAPECSTGTCLLDLRNATGSCFQAPTECAEWFSDPNRDTDYSCHYGTHVVDLSECYTYAPTFTPEASATGEYYADPTTGAAVGAPAGAAPGSDGSTFGESVQDPSQGRECFPTGWAVLNPVEWVMKPVQCALQWAFVPRASVVAAQLATMTATMEGTIPGQLVTAVSGWVFVAPPSDCNGITVDVWFLGPPFQILQACPGDMMEPYALMARIFSNLSFSVYGLVAITRHVSRIFDFPGLGDSQ